MRRRGASQSPRLLGLMLAVWAAVLGSVCVFGVAQQWHHSSPAVAEADSQPLPKQLSRRGKTASSVSEPSGAAHWNPLRTPPGSKGPLGWEGIFLWVPMTLWIFAGIAIVADDYFQPSLEAISDNLGLSEDVRGATFLAAASSAPEFFTSFADTFLVDEDGGEGFGVGTIVGSAVFNILIIVAVSTLPTIRAKKKIEKRIRKIEAHAHHHPSEPMSPSKTQKLEWLKRKVERDDVGYLTVDWYPLARDCVFYALSILLLATSIITQEPSRENRKPGHTEGCVEWYESLLYVLLYAAYILYMVKSAALRPAFEKCKESCCGPPKEDVAGDAASQEPSSSEEDEPALLASVWSFDIAGGWLSNIAAVFTLPFRFLFAITIPNCQRSRMSTDGHYVLAFGMCIFWIAFLSAMMVKTVSWIGVIINLHPVAMGLIVLAAGTSVPDALGSYNEAKRGHAGAAVSNALGSNVFDICAGLGIPWLVYSLVFGRCFAVPRDEIFLPTIVLFCVLALFLGTLAYYRMKLFGTVGLIYVVLYLAFIAWVLVNAFVLNVKM